MNSTTDNTGLVFVQLDGDAVGDRLELFLLDNDVERAKAFSEAIADGMDSLKAGLLAIKGADVIFAGGDDLLAQIPAVSYKIDFIKRLGQSFLERTGCTLSGGVGASPRSALDGLRRAKLSGKNQVVEIF